MKNWLGQEINVGDVVYNARRDGNGTTNRLGRVVSYSHKTEKFSVVWCVEPRRKIWNRETHQFERTEHTYHLMRPSRGSNDIDALVKVEDCEAAAAVPPLDTLI